MVAGRSTGQRIVGILDLREGLESVRTSRALDPEVGEPRALPLVPRGLLNAVTKRAQIHPSRAIEAAHLHHRQQLNKIPWGKIVEFAGNRRMIITGPKLHA